MQRIVRADRRGPAVVPNIEGRLEARPQARREAERIVEHAKTHAAAIEEGARKAGYAAGVEAGRAELASALLEHSAAHERALAALIPETREIALLAARHLLGHELTLQPERITETVEQLLTRVRRARRVRVRAHPEDCVALAASMGQRAIELQPDETLTRGGCIVQTEIGTLDASVETRIASLRKALEKARGRT